MSEKNELDANFLIGGTLQQLALGLYEFQLMFHTNAWLSVQHKLLFENIRKRQLTIEANKPEQSKELYFLLGRTVVDAEIDEDKILKIVFDDQSRIEILPTGNSYESYVLQDKERHITV